jgi:hypothetical protein
MLRSFGRTELKPSEVADLFRLLTMTYPRYIDSVSREAAEGVLKALLTRDISAEGGSELGENKIGQLILDWLAHESGRLGKRGPARCVPCLTTTPALTSLL